MLARVRRFELEPDKPHRQPKPETRIRPIQQDSDPDKFDRAKLVEVLTAPYIEDSGDGIVALDPHALKKLFTTTSSLLQASPASFPAL